MKLTDNTNEATQSLIDMINRFNEQDFPESLVVERVFTPQEDYTDVDKRERPKSYPINREVGELLIDQRGIFPDRHASVYRHSSGRETDLYPKKTDIRQHRHVFMVSDYDCRVISENFGYEVTPELLGANMLVGREDGKDISISAILPGTYFVFANPESEKMPKPGLATLRHHLTQMGCHVMGKAIADHYEQPDSLGLKFKDVSKLNRGIVCSVEYPMKGMTVIEPGMKMYLRYPTWYST